MDKKIKINKLTIPVCG